MSSNHIGLPYFLHTIEQPQTTNQTISMNRVAYCVYISVKRPTATSIKNAQYGKAHTGKMTCRMNKNIDGVYVFFL